VGLRLFLPSWSSVGDGRGWEGVPADPVLCGGLFSGVFSGSLGVLVSSFGGALLLREREDDEEEGGERTEDGLERSFMGERLWRESVTRLPGASGVPASP